MIDLRCLIFICWLLAMPWAMADEAIFGNFKELQVAIPSKMKGWSHPLPPGNGPLLTYQGKGISFMTFSNGAISTNYTWSLKQPVPTATVDQSDPFKMVQQLTYLQKKGDHAGVLKLLDPLTDSETLSILNRPDIIKADTDLYADASGAGILLGIEDGSDLLVYYYIQKPSSKVLQLEILKKSGSSYVLRSSPASKSDSMPINIFTALFGTLQGTSKDIQVNTK